jgi:hypothetical protein
VAVGTIKAFSVDDENRAFLHETLDQGTTWSARHVFTLPIGEQLLDVVSHGNSLTVITPQGSIIHSTDGGQEWNRFRITEPIGQLVDAAEANGLWMVCGTEATIWSANNGVSWSFASVHLQLGGPLTAIEACRGEIWGGGLLGAARFDQESRSWVPMSAGLPTGGVLKPRVVDIKELGGVLFGLFRTTAGANVCCFWKDTAWVLVDRGGLPYGEQVRRFKMSLWRDLLQVYCSGSDPNLQGVYVVKCDAPTHVTDALVPTLHLSPIPATDRLLVRTPDNRQMRAELSDASGRRISLQVVAGYGVIDTSTLPAGMYVLIVSDYTVTLMRTVLIHR